MEIHFWSWLKQLLIVFYFYGIAALALILHCEKSDKQGGQGDVQATDGHADSDPKTLYLHVWCPPDVTRKMLQDRMPEIAPLEICLTLWLSDFFGFKHHII